MVQILMKFWRQFSCVWNGIFCDCDGLYAAAINLQPGINKQRPGACVFILPYDVCKENCGRMLRRMLPGALFSVCLMNIGNIATALAYLMINSRMFTRCIAAPSAVCSSASSHCCGER